MMLTARGVMRDRTRRDEEGACGNDEWVHRDEEWTYRDEE